MTASKKLQSAPSIFEPDSIYLLFVKRDDQTCAGVFHHNSDGKGILAFACMKQQGAIHADTLFEYDLTQGTAPLLWSICPSPNSARIRDRIQVRRHHRTQSSEAPLPRMVTKRPLRLSRFCPHKRRPLDGARLARSRREVGAEGVGLGEQVPSRVPEGFRGSRTAACSQPVVLLRERCSLLVGVLKSLGR
ncbi:hypothetical protein BJ322DRAFT_1038841 [Thelephora terrestris]|uniref:Uncharacterized protein n=1 Tax=Thelephora terrestris TaxID=56493 RepID=A0A9P6LB93_9AGAM|nr:hypothetical protein BJ322DRAFT_1038841 [Thelephora terrestris]